MRRARLAGLALAIVLLPAACGEPDVDLELPARGEGAQVADLAGVLDPSVSDRLVTLREDTGYDVVALTFESERASLGEASRGARLALEEWGADIALTAVGFPGDFTEEDPDARRRFFGIEADRLTVSRGLREQIVEEAVPPPAADNDWTAVFLAAIDVLAAELGPES
jgi:hypothetical protein